MDLPQALIIVDSLDIVSLDFRQLLDSAGYSTELIACEGVTFDGIDRIQPNVIFIHLSKQELPGEDVLELLKNEKKKDVPVVALANHKKVAEQLFSSATVVLLTPVNEQRLINLFTLLSSIDKTVEQSPWDMLTGFYTPSFFNTRLKKALEHSHEVDNSRFIVFTINLEYSSKYNKKDKIQQQQQILQGLAKVLQNVLRPTDIISRFDLNQFMVLIEDATDNFTPATIAGRMHLEFEDYLVSAKLTDHIKVDIGVIYCNSDYRSADEIVHDAQMALQLAKQDIGGSYKVFVRNRPHRKRNPLQSLVRV